MPVVIVPTPTAFRVQIQVLAPPAPARNFVLDMSLQRHCYRNIGGADRKPMNSILENAVTDQMIQADLLDLGRQVEARALGQTPVETPSLAMQLRSARMQLDVHGSVRQAANVINAAVAVTVFGDYTVASRRVYRVDNSAIDVAQQANHCYPIGGPGLWDKVSMEAFGGAAAFRALEILLAVKRDDPVRIWQTLSADPYARDTPIMRAFQVARTDFRPLSDAIQQKIVAVAGALPLHIQMAKAIKLP